jgi:hypothetical protein
MFGTAPCALAPPNVAPCSMEQREHPVASSNPPPPFDVVSYWVHGTMQNNVGASRGGAAPNTGK